MSIPSKGLPSGQTARELVESAASCKAPSRPCLPAVEALGDRIMMSADMMGAPVQPQAVVNPPAQVSQILIGMMKGDTDTFASDLAALKLAAEADPKLGHKFADALVKIDRAVYKLGQDLFKGQVVAPDMVKAAIDRQFSKIETILARHPLEVQSKIAPTIDALQSKVHGLVNQLAAVGPVPALDKADKQTLNKISLDWAQMSKAAIKYQEQIAFNKDASQDFLQVKFTDILVSSAKVENGTLKTEINNAVSQAEQILIGLLLPASTGDVISG